MSESRDAGSAVIEFIVIGVLVLVPMVYAVQAAMAVQRAALASGQAAREAARAFSTAENVADGRARALAAADLAFGDQGLELPADALRLRCAGGPCLAPGTAVEVLVDWRVPLPWLPGGSAAVPVSSLQRVPIDDYRGSVQ